MSSNNPDDELRGQIEIHLKGDYACTRVWEAWEVGTMTQDDFIPLEETERVDEILTLLAQERAKADIAARIDALERVLRNCPMPILSYEQVSDWIAELKAKELESGV